MKNLLVVFISVTFLSISIVSAGDMRNAVATSDHLRMRAQPSLSSDVLGYLNKGILVNVMEQSTFTFKTDGREFRWYKVAVASSPWTSGWVFGSFLSFNLHRAVPRFTSLQQEIVQEWLAKNPQFELPNISEELLSSIMADSISSKDSLSPNYYPYFVPGDFNNDNQEDFAIIIANHKNQERSIAIFNGPLTPAIEPAFISHLAPYNDWLFFFHYGAGEPNLSVGHYAGEGIDIHVKGNTYEFNIEDYR